MKNLKPSQVKTIVVECKLKNSLDTKEYDIDIDIFDDVYLEAATRFAEQHVRKDNAKIPPILSTYEKKDLKNYHRHFCYNSYYVVVNAGFYKKAEILRKNFKIITGVDLKKENIKTIQNDDEQPNTI